MKTDTEDIQIKAEKAPAHTQRYVVWNWSDSNNDGRLVILVGYCPDTLGYFAGLFHDAKKVCPDIKADEAVCAKVQSSSSRQGFTMMVIPIKGPKREIKGFTEERDWSSLDIRSY